MRCRLLLPAFLFAAFLIPDEAWAQQRVRRAVQQVPSSARAAVAETNSMDVLDNKRGLRVGDRISYRVVEDRKAPRQLVVTDSGEVEVPLVGRVGASGKTCRRLAYRIKELLEKDYYHRATVIIGVDVVAPKRSKPRGVVYLMGQVRNQGPVELPANEKLTISKAILRAGGFVHYANQRKVKLVRKKSGNTTQTMEVDVAKILKGDIRGDIVLVPEDLIIVPQRMINF
jgi:polysaccharide export outer membrane protein